MPLIDAAVQLVAPWRTMYDDSTVLSTAVIAVHRPVLAALVVLFASGLALTAADLETFIVSPVYWIKFGVVVLLLANGLFMRRTERALGQIAADPSSHDPAAILGRWRQMRWTSWMRIALWITTLVLGTALVNNA